MFVYNPSDDNIKADIGFYIYISRADDDEWIVRIRDDSDTMTRFTLDKELTHDDVIAYVKPIVRTRLMSLLESL